MGLAHTLWTALASIAEANRSLKANGFTPAKVPAAERDFAERLAFAEITTALKEPARQIVTLLNNRSAALAADAAELEAIAAELIPDNPRWGAF